jgi:hypothetical protein
LIWGDQMRVELSPDLVSNQRECYAQDGSMAMRIADGHIFPEVLLHAPLGQAASPFVFFSPQFGQLRALAVRHPGRPDSSSSL